MGIHVVSDLRASSQCDRARRGRGGDVGLWGGMEGCPHRARPPAHLVFATAPAAPPATSVFAKSGHVVAQSRSAELPGASSAPSIAAAAEVSGRPEDESRSRRARAARRARARPCPRAASRCHRRRRGAEAGGRRERPPPPTPRPASARAGRRALRRARALWATCSVGGEGGGKGGPHGAVRQYHRTAPETAVNPKTQKCCTDAFWPPRTPNPHPPCTIGVAFRLRFRLGYFGDPLCGPPPTHTHTLVLIALLSAR